MAPNIGEIRLKMQKKTHHLKMQTWALSKPVSTNANEKRLLYVAEDRNNRELWSWGGAKVVNLLYCTLWKEKKKKNSIISIFSALFHSLCITPALGSQDKVKSPDEKRHPHSDADTYKINTRCSLSSRHIYMWSPHTCDQSWLINWLKQIFTTTGVFPHAVCSRHKS